MNSESYSIPYEKSEPIFLNPPFGFNSHPCPLKFDQYIEEYQRASLSDLISAGYSTNLIEDSVNSGILNWASFPYNNSIIDFYWLHNEEAEEKMEPNLNIILDTFGNEKGIIEGLTVQNIYDYLKRNNFCYEVNELKFYLSILTSNCELLEKPKDFFNLGNELTYLLPDSPSGIKFMELFPGFYPSLDEFE